MSRPPATSRSSWLSAPVVCFVPGGGDDGAPRRRRCCVAISWSARAPRRCASTASTASTIFCARRPLPRRCSTARSARWSSLALAARARLFDTAAGARSSVGRACSAVPPPRCTPSGSSRRSYGVLTRARRVGAGAVVTSRARVRHVCAAIAVHGVRSPHAHARGNDGQASVELVALLPLVALVGAAARGRPWSPARRCGCRRRRSGRGARARRRRRPEPRPRARRCRRAASAACACDDAGDGVRVARPRCRRVVSSGSARHRRARGPAGAAGDEARADARARRASSSSRCCRCVARRRARHRPAARRRVPRASWPAPPREAGRGGAAAGRRSARPPRARRCPAGRAIAPRCASRAGAVAVPRAPAHRRSRCWPGRLEATATADAGPP